MVNLVVAELSSTCRVKTQLPLPKFFRSPFIFTVGLNNKPEQRKYFGFRLSSANMLRLLRVQFSYNIRMVEHRHSAIVERHWYQVIKLACVISCLVLRGTRKSFTDKNYIQNSAFISIFRSVTIFSIIP